MIVYIETNFLLELAFEQEQIAAAEAILQLAETGALRLIFPSFALSEAFSTIKYRSLEREQIADALTRQAREMGRSSVLSQVVAQIDAVVAILIQTRKSQSSALKAVIARLLAASEWIDLTAAAFQQARHYEAGFGLSAQDAIIYAVVVADLPTQDPQEAKCFISRDTTAFNDQRIKAELGQFNCRYISNFADALRFIQSTLPSAP